MLSYFDVSVWICICKNRSLQLESLSNNGYVTLFNRNILHSKIGREETSEHITIMLGECCISCELELAGPEYKSQQGFSSIPEAIAENLFSCDVSAAENGPRTLKSDAIKLKEASVVVDNTLSPAHSLLQIQCRDKKGLIYDIFRISKDCEIQV